jgi:starch-binding outer membrane protein, SusD/RagB family
MKNLINSKLLLAAGVSAMLLSTACTDLKTVETDSTVVAASDGTVAKIDPAKGLTSAYSKMDVYTDQANIYALGQHTSAQMIPPTRGTDWGDNGIWRTLDQHTWDATHGQVKTTWNQLNERIYNCNEILYSNPTPLQAAEAKLIRAFHMYHVMDYFGQVPFRNVGEGVEVNPKVMTRAEAVAFIAKDLTEALADLPKSGPSATNSKGSKAAANFLLAKLHLNKHIYTGAATPDKADMAKVVAFCDAITADGFSLEDKYFDNFSTAATKEVIWVTETGSPTNRYAMTLHYNTDFSGWNGFTTLGEFYDKFDKSKDQRAGIPAAKDGSKFAGIGRGFLEGQQYDKDGKALQNRRKEPLDFTRKVQLAGANENMGIRVIKYHPANAGKYILMRNGAAQLMKAEAQHRSGDPGALVTINALRAKRGLGALTALTDDVVFDEINRETYWEGGARTEEIRFGKFLTGAGAFKKDASTLLFPIPANAVSSNPNLRQNPGY